MDLPGSTTSTLQDRRHNLIDAAILLLALISLVCFASWCLAGFAGLAGVAFALSACLFLEPKIPAHLMLRAYEAELQPASDSQLSSLVDVLAWRAGLEKRPDFYVIPSLTLSAFSCGTAAAPAIAVSEGLLRRLSLRETAAMIAHEMAHIRNGDLLVFGLADAVTRLSQILAYLALPLAALNLVRGVGDEWVAWPWVALMYAAPLVTNGLQSRMTRTRELDADRFAVTLTGDAPIFVAALRRLESFEAERQSSPLDDLRLPVPGRRIPFPSLLRTHPPVSSRVAAVNGQSPVETHQPLIIAEQPRVPLIGYGPGDMRPRIRWTGVWY